MRLFAVDNSQHYRISALWEPILYYLLTILKHTLGSHLIAYIAAEAMMQKNNQEFNFFMSAYL